MERVEKTRSEAASWHPKLVSPNFVSVSLCYANREREREGDLSVYGHII